MRAISLIARDTILELSRRKVLLAILIAVALTALFFIASIAFEPFVVHRMVERMNIEGSASPEQIELLTKQLNAQGYNLLVSIFTVVIEFLGTIMALIMFATLLPGEIERGSIKFLISKPVSRFDVVMGKWAGGGAVLLCYSACVSLLQVLASLYLTGGLIPDDLRAFPFLFCKLLIRGSVVMCLSTLMRPILAGILAFFISGDILSFIAKFMSESVQYYLLTALSLMLPNYSIFPVRSFFASMARAMDAGVPELSALDIAARCLYALLYVAAALALSVKMFNRKDLT